MTHERCETCRWWAANAPEPLREKPKPTKFLWWTVEPAGRELGLTDWTNAGIRERNESGVCRRMPKPLQAHKTHYCGEWQEYRNDQT